MKLKDDDTEISELEALDVMKISGVDAPANGTPWLLLKAAAPSSTHHHQETKVVKTPKSAAEKAIRRAMRQRQTSFAAQKSVADSRAAVLAPRLARIAKLEKALRDGLPGASPQDVRCVQMDVSLQKLAMAHELAAFQMAPANELAASRASTASAQSNATGASINARRGQAEAQLRSAYDQSYQSQTLPGSIELPSLRQNHLHDTQSQPMTTQAGDELDGMQKRLRTLRKQLADTRDPLELQRLGDQVTLLQLGIAHRQGIA